MPVQDRELIQGLLDGMRAGPTATARLDGLRRLLALLNYSIARSPLSVTLPPDVKRIVADGPNVMATAGGDATFLVVHTQLSTESLSRGAERTIVTALLKDHPYALFTFSNADHSRWHLLNVKVARREASEENRDARLRRLFRRISIAPEDRLRTATERVEKLDLAAINPDLTNLSPLAIQEAHDDAFDVEAVTKQFFQEYKRVFEHVEDAVTGIRGPDKRRLFTQRLFNRLMFIAFIQKKGWLKFPGMEENEYLGAVWRDYQAKKKENSNFYADRLAHLFFYALNSPIADNIAAKLAKRAKVAPVIGDVPYLNGGLFEKSDDGTDDADAGIVIPDKAIDKILGELFARFNFTVTESTPLDVEVAVDPEMLGKVFEELVTGRHETGSYYTPKPIGSFMCREALKGYLETRCPSESEDAIAQFVDEHDAVGLRDGEAVLDALKKIKCCDPACGSGAYLLGMMHELLDLRQTLFKTNKKLDPIKTYERKLEIIQNNVYGVDLDPFAVNIARLRLWLSLAVDFEGEAPPPLPNLDFKIEPGDSLAAPDPSDAGQLQLQKPLVDEFLALKREYLMSHSQRKKELKKEIETLRDHIRAWTHTSGALPENAFDWQVEFAEVFVAGGFDVVLANPPYVRMELIQPQKPLLRTTFSAVYSGRADLYVYFYARALQLLSVGGSLCFISSNKWFRAAYGAALRRHIRASCAIRSVTDFGDLPVFANTSAYAMIFVAARGGPTDSFRFTKPSTLAPPYPDVHSLTVEVGADVPASTLDRTTWSFEAPGANTGRHPGTVLRGMPLRECIGGAFFRGVMSGCNSAFIVDGQTRASLIEEDAAAREVIKPVIAGRDIKRWSIERREEWLLFCPWDFELERYPSIKRHLTRFKDVLSTRPDVLQNRHKWWCLSRYGAGFTGDYEKPKIMFPDIAVSMRFAYDDRGTYGKNTTYSIPTDDMFLLGVLNSAVVERFYRQECAQIRGGYLRFFTQYVENIPIPEAAGQARAAVADLAKRCLNARGVGCEQWETEIDERVVALYGL